MDILQKSNEAGANTVQIQGFDLADPRAYRKEAIRTATQNAIADAEALAGAANLELVRIININLDSAHLHQTFMKAGMAQVRAEMDTAGGGPPIFRRECHRSGECHRRI